MSTQVVKHVQLHYQNPEENSDKVYNLDLLRDDSSGRTKYTVVAKFGKRNTNLRRLILVAGADEMSATTEFNKKYAEQLKQGYKLVAGDPNRNVDELGTDPTENPNVTNAFAAAAEALTAEVVPNTRSPRRKEDQTPDNRMRRTDVLGRPIDDFGNVIDELTFGSSQAPSAPANEPEKFELTWPDLGSPNRPLSQLGPDAGVYLVEATDDCQPQLIFFQMSFGSVIFCKPPIHPLVKDHMERVMSGLPDGAYVAFFGHSEALFILDADTLGIESIVDHDVVKRSELLKEALVRCDLMALYASPAVDDEARQELASRVSETSRLIGLAFENGVRECFYIETEMI